MPLTRWPLAAAALLLAAALALYWPGYALFDTVAQFGQVLSGSYDDWHPPIMARLWAGLHALVGGGAGPMLAVQLTLYWLGLGLIAGGLARAARPVSAAVVLAVGACPLFLGWQAAVLKDAQMAGALLAVSGIVAERRLAGRRLGWARGAAVAVLLGYAVLVRANAVFAAAPLAASLLLRTPWRRGAAALAGIAAVLLIAPIINHALLGADASGVETTQPTYDLAGIARFGGADALTPAQVAAIRARHCYTPFFWDPLGEPGHCGALLQALRDQPRGALARQWLGAVLGHPIAYAEHRLGHLNSTERWLVPADWPEAAPPAGSEANDEGLASPGILAARVQAIGGALTGTPIGWPFAWVVLGLAALATAVRRQDDAAGAVALALLVSALAMEASFGVISIASDLRYHLWSMIAAALACVLLARPTPARRVLYAGGAMLAIVLAIGIGARLVMPPAPASYAAMLG